MSRVTTHVLDTAAGRPAAGVGLVLEARADDGGWLRVAAGMTDDDGRSGDLLAGDGARTAGVYRLVFATGAYLHARHGAGFYPEVSVVFTVDTPDDHYHVPLLLSPYGYSTYRGS